MKMNWLTKSISIRGVDDNLIVFSETADRDELVVSIHTDNNRIATVRLNAEQLREVERVRYILELQEGNQA